MSLSLINYIFQTEYMVDNMCFTASTPQIAQIKHCKDQAVAAYEIFKDLQTERNVTQETDACV